VSGLVDIADLLPLVDHPRFQRLRYRRQLGLLHLTYPGAVHSRFEHSLGTAHLTRQALQRLRLDAERARTLVIYALLHDLGHAPFSHQVEPLFPENHRQRGARLLAHVEREVRRCGGDPDLLARLYAGADPACQIVEDRNLGADKLDYLARDAHHVGLTGAPDVQKLQAYMVFVQDRLAIEEKLTEEVKRSQFFYTYLYREVYLNKQSLIVQRMLQRALEAWIDATGVQADDVLDNTDAAIEERLRASSIPQVRAAWQRLHERRILRSAAVARIEGYEYQERLAGKALYLAGLPEARVRGVIRFLEDPRRTTELEDRIADMVGIPRGDVVIAARQFFDRLAPRDVALYSQARGQVVSLFDREPHHHKGLNDQYLGLFALRVAVPQEFRPTAADRGKEIIDLLFRQVA
jgi:HD superfamily phosphohydrolase